MLVFIDESGDPGFNSANKIFVIALIVFANKEDTQAANQKIDDLAKKLSKRDEFKFSKCSYFMRDTFLKPSSQKSSKFML